MGFEKIKNFWKKIIETQSYYFRERRIIGGVTLAAFLLITMNTVLYIGDHVELNYGLYFILSVIISPILSLLTFIQIEKSIQNNKISSFKKFLEKIIKIESSFKNKKIKQLIAIFITFLVFYIYSKIAILHKSFYTMIFQEIISLTLAFQLCFFVYDLMELINEKIIKRKPQLELKEENNYENI